MTRIWLELSHHTAFRVGGWAFVRADGAAVTGHAGGERRIDAERGAVLGLLAALRGLEGPATLATASPLVAAIAARDAPAGVQVVRIAAGPGSPAAFCAVWAEFARDKAKDKGAFSFPIPRPNLAKAGVA